MVKTRVELDEAIARLLADALVRELRAEMAVQTNAPTGGSVEARQTNESENGNNTTGRLPRAS